MWLHFALYWDATWAILRQVTSLRQAVFVEEPMRVCVCVCVCVCTLTHTKSCDISLCIPTDMGGM